LWRGNAEPLDQVGRQAGGERGEDDTHGAVYVGFPERSSGLLAARPLGPVHIVRSVCSINGSRPVCQTFFCDSCES
jgi:hypothetical protein